MASDPRVTSTLCFVKPRLKASGILWGPKRGHKQARRRSRVLTHSSEA